MHHLRSFFTPIFVVGLILFCSAFASAQQIEPSYDVSLQLIIGSDEAGSRGEMPSELTAVAKQIKGQFGFGNYRLASTFLGRLTNSGSFSYKSASNIFGKESQGQLVFLEWSVSEFHSIPNGKGGHGFSTESLNFGARVPVTTSVSGSEGKSSTITNYESVGLNLRKVSLPESVPTMIGTLNLPGASGTIFLIMTVRSAD